MRWSTPRWGQRNWGAYRSYSFAILDDGVARDVPDAIPTRVFRRPGLTTSDTGVTHGDSLTRRVRFGAIRPGPIPALLRRELCAKALRMLDDMPPYEADEPWVQLYVDTLARELTRLEEFADLLRQQFWPQNADEDNKALSMWEGILNLPIEPNGVRPPTRRAVVMTKLRARHVISGKRWVELLTAMLGSENWTHEEGPDPYTITITIPFRAGTWRAGQVEQLARAITPAHLFINAEYAEGFILNESLLSEDRL